jgi:hypothetical protein
VAYRVEILDSNQVPVTKIQGFVPLDPQGHFLSYKSRLSNFAECRFRIGKNDPKFTQLGNIVQPFASHVRIYRFNILVWSGIVTMNSQRTSNFIEVVARDYLYLLSKVLIRHDTSGDVNYRTLNSGTMATYIRTLMTEAKADGMAPLTSLTIGTIENPKFPANFTDSNNANIGGQEWTYSANLSVKYDYRDALFVLQSQGVYGVCDFELTKDLIFNFKKFLGTKQPNLMFEYGRWGAIEDYNVPLNGDRMANYLVGVASDVEGTILHVELSDDASIKTYGKVMGVAAYNDVKNINLLRARLASELKLVSTPDAEINITLNDRAYPLGQYGIGDIVTVKIKDGVINVNSQRRIVGIDVDVHVTGKEQIRLITNVPRDDQV